MKDKDDLRISEPISTGLSQLSTVGTDLGTAWAPVKETIQSLNAARPWGDGHEGAAFAMQYLANGGPEQLIEDTDKVVKQIGKIGPKLRKTIANSLATEAALKASMRQA